MGFGDNHVAFFDFAGEQIVQFADIQYGNSRRQFTVEHDVFAVRRGVTAVRRVRHRDVAGIFGVGFCTTVQHFHAVDFFEVAVFDAFFDGGKIEDHAPVLLVGRSTRNGQGAFGVIAGSEGVFALVVGIAVVQVAVHQYLPCDVHGFAVDCGVNGIPSFRIVPSTHAAYWYDVFAVGKDIAGFRITLRTQTVDTGSVRDFGDFVGFHEVQAYAANTVVCFVVGIRVATVVSLVGKRQVRVVQVAVRKAAQTGIFQEFIGFRRIFFIQNTQALVGTAPTGRAVHVEHRDTHQFTHGWQTDQTHFA